jgi:hypothetical protein
VVEVKYIYFWPGGPPGRSRAECTTPQATGGVGYLLKGMRKVHDDPE